MEEDTRLSLIIIINVVLWIGAYFEYKYDELKREMRRAKYEQIRKRFSPKEDEE